LRDTKASMAGWTGQQHSGTACGTKRDGGLTRKRQSTCLA
jgi:hypothetical protein